MAGVSFEAALDAVKRRLGRRSVEHSLAVADTAGRLAELYDVDGNAARLAGLLHDWSRDDGDDRLLAEARRLGIEVDPADETVPYLLHAQTGAAELRKAFPGISEDVVRAVERHTLGAEDMSDLDMVVYIADMTEPSRTFEGVEELRSAVGEVPLPELFVRGYAHSLTHVIKRRRHLHPRTALVWNAAVDAAARDREESW